MNEKIKELLQIESKRLQLAFEMSSIEGYGTPQEIADRREKALISVLKKYYPSPYRIVKGNIIDSYGNNSNSIDCVLLNPCHPNVIDFANEKASIIFADGVDAIVEVKGNLIGKKEIHRLLDQIRSVKKLRRKKDGVLLKNKYNYVQLEYLKQIPCVVFAEKTYENPRVLIEKIVDYYLENKFLKMSNSTLFT